jgi:nicotinamide-nucleotide amidase
MDARIAAMEARVRERLGQYVWGTDEETLGSVIGAALQAHGWKLATAEALSVGDVSRALAQAPGANEWFESGVVIPHAGAESLARAIAHSDAQVKLIVPHGETSAELVATTPERPRTLTIRFGSATEGRRRALLGALDLLRRTLTT